MAEQRVDVNLPRGTVIGNPIEHSLSPQIQALFSEMTGVPFAYDRTLVPLDGFQSHIFDIAHSGLIGANVTRPFKFDALQAATHATERARFAGAANTLRFDVTPQTAGGEKVWWADNTDGVGLVRDITQNAGVALRDRALLLIGAGGAASGVLSVLLEARPKLLVVLNRTLQRAADLVAQHQLLAGKHGVELVAGCLSEKKYRFDVVVNSSSSSQDGYPPPVSGDVLKPGALAVDMTYGAAAEPFMRWAKLHHAHGRDGLGMLVEQGAESFHFWHGVMPESAVVLKKMRSLLSNKGTE